MAPRLHSDATRVARSLPMDTYRSLYLDDTRGKTKFRFVRVFSFGSTFPQDNVEPIMMNASRLENSMTHLS